MAPTDPLGSTFDELCTAPDAPRGDRRALRHAYQRLMTGSSETDPLAGEIPPIVRQEATDGVTKFVQATSDALEIESVLVPMRRRAGEHWTVCVSSQIGCARGCAFCQTAQLGLLRNLTAGEIVAQVVAAQRLLEAPIRNVVFMGMGEPLDNLDAVLQAIRVLRDPAGLSLAGERIRISTVGRIAGIRRLAEERLRRSDLAISLNAPNDAIRAQLMPISRTDPMPALRTALQEYPLRNCQFFMIEYVLIPGVNDALDHARELAEYLRGLPSMVNVIPYNPRSNSPWPAPSSDAVRRFVAELKHAEQPARTRVTKGRDLMAACGQLGNLALRRCGT